MKLTPDQFRSLNSDEQLSAALQDVEEGARPLVVCFRDGKEIAGNWCRLTINTLALLDISGNAIFAHADESDTKPTVRDCIESIFICSDEYEDQVVWIIDDKEKLSKAVDKFSRAFWTRKSELNAANKFYSWLSDMYGAMQSPESGEGSVKQGQWWADSVDVIASEYHWDEEYIFRRLPIVRAYQYHESIAARRGGTGRVNEIPDSMCRALVRMDEVLGVEPNGQS